MPEGTLPSEIGLSESDIRKVMLTALAGHNTYADIYCERNGTLSISCENGIVNSIRHGSAAGVGIHVLNGDRSGYAYTEELTLEGILNTANVARQITQADASASEYHKILPTPLSTSNLLSQDETTSSIKRLVDTCALITASDGCTRFMDPDLRTLQMSFGEQVKEITIFCSDGNIGSETRRFSTARVRASLRSSSGRSATGAAAFSTSANLHELVSKDKISALSNDAVRRARLQLEAIQTPAGEMPVVLGPGSTGFLLHEAIGHGLEADCVRKGASVYSGCLGHSVASSLCTIVDAGSLSGNRGSFKVDDEGVPSGTTVLVENGILRMYLADRLSSSQLNIPLTGNGRRESYRVPPLPRMSNTFMLPGRLHPDEIVASVAKGIYCTRIGNGQVDVTNGKFAFRATEAYLIQNGRISSPLRDVLLVGSGPAVLKQISMVADDLSFDNGVIRCGKDGQSVPVDVGLPSIKIDGLMVTGKTDVS